MSAIQDGQGEALDIFSPEPEPMTPKDSFLVRAGRFLFRYRSLLFPIIFIAMLGILRPHPYLPAPYYGASMALGLAITLTGEAIRVLTIGLDYIERGGKNRQPFASRLVTHGVYAHVRNPMYLGNLLIAVGIGLYSGAPMALVTVLPFFVFVYIAIISAEENFLGQAFGEEYREFTRRVPRLIPNLKGISSLFSGFTFNWKRVVAKENGTAFYTFLALTLLPIWRAHFLTGGLHVHAGPLLMAASLAAGYATARLLTKKGLISY
jgi:protein-S-isoprenylcysteine O-methyltransferase Ste14